MTEVLSPEQLESNASCAREVSRRRTFAIISHPDAGKSTLTEKLLLYSGVLRTAGMVRAKSGDKGVASDWMSMEQERGISITASAMQFPYKDHVVNLLDTPGHQDFSEDTYRTLTATDSAVMVLDAVKGVEAQTRKLFAVCRMRNVPILTFINKMDLPARDPFELIQEVEDVLGIHATPLHWPIGAGKKFRGIIECNSKKVHLFEKSLQGGKVRAADMTLTLDEARDQGFLAPDEVQRTQDELALLEGAGTAFSRERFLAGEITPMFFGSALTNFGVEPFFDEFVSLAPSPRGYPITLTDETSRLRDPVSESFAAFVFKIQANMNPKHRDSMAFMRICSGRFERDMTVFHHRTGKELRLARAYGMVGRDRTTVEEAFPGDIIGVINPGMFSIGDTVSLSKGFSFAPMPQFPPEVVARIRPKDILRHKSFEKGLMQLCEEGAIQQLHSYDMPQSAPYVAAVGRLQFDVLQHRLREEYNVETEIEPLPHKLSAWVKGPVAELKRPSGALLTKDRYGRVIILFTGEWEKRYTMDQNPKFEFPEFVDDPRAAGLWKQGLK